MDRPCLPLGDGGLSRDVLPLVVGEMEPGGRAWSSQRPASPAELSPEMRAEALPHVSLGRWEGPGKSREGAAGVVET